MIYQDQTKELLASLEAERAKSEEAIDKKIERTNKILSIEDLLKPYGPAVGGKKNQDAPKHHQHFVTFTDLMRFLYTIPFEKMDEMKHNSSQRMKILEEKMGN